MSPPTWTPDETSDSSLWSQLQQLSKIAAFSEMVWHPSMDRGHHFLSCASGLQEDSRGGAWVGGVLGKFPARGGMWFLLRHIVGPGTSLLISVNWPHSLPLTSLSKPSRKNLGARAWQPSWSCWDRQWGHSGAPCVLSDPLCPLSLSFPDHNAVLCPICRPEGKASPGRCQIPRRLVRSVLASHLDASA